MSDSEGISALLGQEVIASYQKRVPIKNFYDTNGNNYSTGRITFDSLNLMKNLVEWHNGYFEAPMRVCVGTVTGSANTTFGAANTVPVHGQDIGVSPAVVITSDAAIAIKNGVWSMIKSLRLRLGNTDIQNALHLPLYNNIKAMIDNDVEWALSHGELYHFSPDTIAPNREVIGLDNVEFPTVAVNAFDGNPAVAGATTNVSGRQSATYNEGFANRVRFLNLWREDTITTALNFTVRIPLKMFSSFFSELKHPLINTRVQMEFEVAGIAPNDTYYPLCTTHANAILNGVGTTLIITGQTRIVVHEVELPSAIKIQFDDQLRAGKTSTVVFWDQKHFQSQITAADDLQDTIIVPSIKNPKRVWAIFQNAAAGAWASEESTQPCTSSTTAKLTSSNIEVNNIKMFPSDINSDYEHFKLLQRETFSGEDSRNNGCLLTYSNFLTGSHRYYVYNIARSDRAIKDPTEQVMLRFVGSKTDVAAPATRAELHFIVEYECITTINMTTGDVLHIGS